MLSTFGPAGGAEAVRMGGQRCRIRGCSRSRPDSPRCTNEDDTTTPYFCSTGWEVEARKMKSGKLDIPHGTRRAQHFREVLLGTCTCVDGWKKGILEKSEYLACSTPYIPSACLHDDDSPAW